MKRNTQSTLATILVFASIVAVILHEAFADKLREIEWFEIDKFIIPVIICFAIGTILGWVNFRFQLGKLAAIAGSAALVLVIFIFVFKSGPP